ncbi:MAG: hypothetical protein QXU40_03220, partial [Candidatus Pacearchaeota archaeon]
MQGNIIENKKYIQQLEAIRRYNPYAKLGSVTSLSHCRACGNEEIIDFLSLGLMPKPNGFIKSEDLCADEFFYPLDVCFCNICGLVQLRQLIDPRLMFDHYVYATSASAPMIKHLQKFTADISKKLDLNDNSFVVDIGSNDGTLLKQFKKISMRVLGVDPAENIAKKASEEGIPTEIKYFNEKTAQEIVE